MNKIKDLIYDYNDIFLAVIIIALAAGVIFWRLSGIMDYTVASSKTEAESTADVDFSGLDLEQEDVEQINENPEEFNSEETQQTVEETAQSSASEVYNSTTEEFTVKSDVRFEIPSGYISSKIGKKLENEGICSAADFIDEVEKQKADTKLKAGTFTIPAGSTVADIVKILSK